MNTVREFDFYGSSESSYDDMGTREEKQRAQTL